MKADHTTEELSAAELCKARQDLAIVLRRKGISARWVAEHGEEVLSQACAEYAAWLSEGRSAERPVGWLVSCAWRRTQDLLRSEGRRPRAAPLEGTAEIADTAAPSPEQVALEHEREQGLRGALAQLPEKECRLLGLVYFEEHSVREAGRKLGWAKTSADRHHRIALEKVRVLLGSERELPSPALLGLAAWIAARGEGGRAVAELTRALAHRLTELWRRIAPFTDPAGAAAAGGSGRALGACGLAAATLLCGIAASNVLPTPTGGEHKRMPSRPTASSERGAPAAAPSGDGPTAPSSPSSAGSEERQRRPVRRAVSKRRLARPSATAPTATAAQTATEFGIESGAASEGGTATGAGSEQPSVSAATVPAAPSPSHGNGGSGDEGAAATREFGL